MASDVPPSNALPSDATPTEETPSDDNPVESWDVDDVVAFLEEINLGILSQVARDNALCGQDLVDLTQDELQHDLGITRMQARKIKQQLNLPTTGASDAPATAGQAAPANAPQYPEVGGAMPAFTAATDQPADLLSAMSAGRMQRAPQPHQGVPVQNVVGSAQQAAPSYVGVDASIAAKWGETMELIRRLEAAQVALRLPAARERLSGLQQRSNAELKKLKQLQEEMKKNDANYKELEDGDWYFGKYLFGKKKREEKVEKAEAVIAEGQHKVKASGAVLEDLSVKIAAQTQEVNTLEMQVTQLSSAKQWETNLLPSLFDGVAGDPREYQLEKEFLALAPRVTETRMYKQRYSQAYELIRNGRKQLDQAIELLQHATGMANAGMVMNVMGGPRRGVGMGRRGMGPGMRRGMGNTPGGMMVDAMKQSQMKQGAQMVNAACDSVVRAKEIIPDMPRVDLKTVKGLKGLGLIDIFSRSLVIDLVVRKKIMAALETARSMLNDVVYAEKWLQGWIDGRINIDLQAIEGAYAAKKTELDAARRDILKRAVDALSAGKQQQAVQQGVAQLDLL